MLRLLSLFMFLSTVFSNSDICLKAPANNCISFTVSQGTGCAWMCNFCASQLGTNNYYFTDSVCTYEQGVGCVGSPLAGKTYTCCSV
jgi:hypothetical protein